MSGYRRIAAPVRGGELVAGVWEPEGEPVATVLAVHGITASHMTWPMLVDALPGVRVVAPDLRGRGGSRDLPGPWGMVQHAEDLARVLDAVDVEAATVVGHSMGAFASVRFASRHPERTEGLVLVDGGLPLPSVEVSDDEDVALRLIGPAAERLRMTFPDRESYRAFWRAHPAFARDWSPFVERYVDYDLVGQEPELHSSSSIEAITADSLELNADGGYLAALQGIARPIPFLRAPRGLLDQPEALYPPATVAHWQALVPELRVHEVADVNHYTILMTAHGVAAVAAVVRDVLDHRTEESTTRQGSPT
ncbi:alpha/beta fold hydrolase [Leifsonia sp. H3M29-4]|uniref:alpha/beta fold hydrolase n=1 Tax=Salinibacterium metalliresistens TaxID=3031321 RepID=UPI0023DACA09|nr:alpha/beta fold hydrolase [Salinibacterium metalliresistens]MDF1480051.1 alpha/beta fold hydrolase [Salinibacterium metalliresistens]